MQNINAAITILEKAEKNSSKNDLKIFSSFLNGMRTQDLCDSDAMLS